VGTAARFNQPIALDYNVTTGILNVLETAVGVIRQIAPDGTVRTITKKTPS
jgi:hypothetical protein